MTDRAKCPIDNKKLVSERIDVIFDEETIPKDPVLRDALIKWGDDVARKAEKRD